MTTFYSWLFWVQQGELELCNLFLIISKQRGRESEILVLVDVKFYWLLTCISFVKICILHFAVERYKVRHVIFQEIGYDPPEQVVHNKRRSHNGFYIMSRQSCFWLKTSDTWLKYLDVKIAFHELLDSYQGYRLIFTNGSRLNTSVACAFTVNIAFFSYKLQASLSIYTAELVAICEALKFVCNNCVHKAIICTDSQSAIKALGAVLWPSGSTWYPRTVSSKYAWWYWLCHGVDQGWQIKATSWFKPV